MSSLLSALSGCATTSARKIQKLVSSMLAKGYSVQTVKHVRTTMSAIFTHAKRLGCHSGDNPAKLVRLPEMIRKEAHALTFDQSIAALRKLKSPAREMVLFAILTSMNIAEICGLQWKRVNLTDQFATAADDRCARAMVSGRVWQREGEGPPPQPPNRGGIEERPCQDEREGEIHRAG